MAIPPAPVGLQWQNVADLAVLTVAIYAVLLWARKARAVRIVFLLLCLYGAAVGASYVGLTMTAWVLRGGSLITLVMLFVLFQPEVRHSIILLVSAVSKVGSSRAPPASVHKAISEAAFALASKRLGALVAVARSGPLCEGVAHGGIPLGAAVSSELIEAVFLRDSPLHDGAAIVEGDRMTRAGVLLPVSSRTDIPSHLGSRHRAAVGLAECCDAAAIVVSEERGEVRLILERGIWLMDSAAGLCHRLQDLQERSDVRLLDGIPRLAAASPGLALAALVLAGLVWLVRLLEPASR